MTQNPIIISKVLWSANQLIDLGLCHYDINNPQCKFGEKINSDIQLNGSFMIPDDNKKFTFTPSAGKIILDPETEMEFGSYWT